LTGLDKVMPGKPCFGYQLKRCKGACVGNEPLAKHSMRLLSAIVRLKLVSWPFSGPAILREQDEAHLINGWRYLGTAKCDADIFELLAMPRPPFDRDTYKILAKNVSKMVCLANNQGLP
jgi:DNA polymerase-3 subunit epsilon